MQVTVNEADLRVQAQILAERILNIDPLLDLSRLGPQRIVDGEPIYENAGRLI